MGNQLEYVYTRGYRGRVKGLVLDWSGTTADAYVLAPAVVFVEVFSKQNVEISMTEARGPMGLRKDLHIKVLTKVPEIKERWKGGAWKISRSVRRGSNVRRLCTDAA